MITGGTKFYVVGCYVAPTDGDTGGHVHAALADCPKGWTPLVLGDFNADLCNPATRRADALANVINENNLVDLAHHFEQRQTKQRVGKRWTWRQRRQGRWFYSQPDYFLEREQDQRLFWQVGF